MSGSCKLFLSSGLFLISFKMIISASTGFTVSIYDVTSRTVSLHWPKFPDAFSYKVMATPVNTLGHSLLAHFSDVTVVGTLSSLAPNTIYSVMVDAIDKNGIILAETQIMQLTAPEIPMIDQAYSKLSSSITVEWAAVSGASSYLLTAQDGEMFIETIVTNSPGTVTGLKAATLYKITIRSINTGGRSQSSPSKKAKTVLAAPVMIANSPSYNNIVVSWNAVYMAVGFFVSIMRSDGLGSMLKENTTNNSLTFSSLDPGTLYTIKVYAWDINGIPGDDFTYNQRTRPRAPGDVQVVFDSGSLGAIVSCMPAEGASSYSIAAYSNTSKWNFTSTSTSCTISSLKCGAEYSLTVVASNEAGSSVPTEAVIFKTAPCAPESITIEEKEPGNLAVSWSDVDLSDYYVAFVKSDDGLEVHCNTSCTQCLFQSDCGFTYFISVFAYNKAGQSPLGDIFNYTTAPCCPSNFSPVFVSSNTVQIIWSPVRGAEMYETKAVAQTSELLCNDTATTCTFSALQCNTQYNITVYSFNEIRGSNMSCEPKQVTTAPCSPEILNISKDTPSIISVHWHASSDGAMYTVTVKGEAGRWHCTSSGNSCSIHNLPCGSLFFINVVANTEAGYSLPSYSVPLETGTKIHFRLSDYPPKPEMTVLKKQYPDPKELLEIDLEFKAEQLKLLINYPSGRVAILITYIREIQFTYIVLNDSKTHELQALFTNQGYAAYYQQNEKLRLSLDLCTGSFFDKNGNREKYWNWWDNRSHVHAPPFQPICIQLNAYIQVKIKAQDQIFLTFTKCHDCLQLNVGARLKLKDPDMLWVLQQYGTSDQLVSHSMLDKISNLLTSIKELLKTLCSNAPEESGDLRLLSQLYAIMHRRCKKTSYRQRKKRN